MPNRYPKDSVLVPQWKRVEDGLPESLTPITMVARGHNSTWIEHGYRRGSFLTNSGTDPGGRVTHWSPRVGIPLPEEE